MQTPTGYQIVETTFGPRAQMTNFLALLSNPSFPVRLAHTVLAAWLTGAFLVLSVSAWYILKKQHLEFAKSSMKIAILVALTSGIAQFIMGDLSARIVAEYQPTKLAAEEGHWPASAPAPLYIFGWVDVEAEKTYGIAIPGGTSILLYGDPKAPVTGIKAFTSEELPPLQTPFQSFHLMVAIYFSLIALVFLGVFLYWRKRLFTSRWILWLLVFSVAGPMIANQLGWATAEVGRQPWIVYNLLRTKDAFSPNLTAVQVTTSIIMFTVIYVLLLILFLFLLNEKIQHGPGPEDQPGAISGLPDTLREILSRK
jgi:cytochrome d ubiquinol oxidase subunit I